MAQPVHPDSTLEALRPVIFSLKKQPTSAGIATLPNGDSAVVVLTDIHVPLPTKVAAKEQEKFEQFLVKRNGELAYRLYTKGLYASANIVNHLH
ncbi:MAG: hypothetical protein A3J38_07465 [Gammaproteobacteria bacterium RIFCSPHIGHO2_12_FULL_45_9]|nr:MAG: hypothetical protein A3J38_07465 [Gammaproteobacteria bacterium RIFCSPHIGHO2_12_FULL_45_9]